MFFNNLNKDNYKQFIEEILCDYCESGKYCILKEFVISAHPSPKLLMQLKCIDKFKYEKSKENGEDIGWNKSIELWASEGYAKKFSDFYTDTIKFDPLYKKIKS